MSVRSLHIRILPALLTIVAVLFVPQVGLGGTIRDDVPDQQYLDLAAQTQFSAVGEIEWDEDAQGYISSGTYLGNGWVLTAGHVVGGTDNAGGGISNATFTINGHAYSGSRFIPNPGWTSTSGDLKAGDDIGLMRLAQDVPDIAPVTLYTGTGLTGYTDSSYGTKRAGQNVIDNFGGSSNPRRSWLRSYSSNIMFIDFDNPHNAASSSLGSSIPLALEYLIAPGDSGGGDFIQVSGQWYLAGVTSFLSATDGSIDASYGDSGGFARVSRFATWINQTMAQPLLSGDANRDGKVSFADYLVLEANFGKTGMTRSTGDFNNDGKVSFADYLILEADFGKSVPEPASLALLGLGGLFLRKRPAA
jgi:hypothetical protein